MRIGGLEELSQGSVGVDVEATLQSVARRDDRDPAPLLLDDRRSRTRRLHGRPFGHYDYLAQADPQRALPLIEFGAARLAQVDVQGIANGDEARLHVEPVRQAAELAGLDLPGDLEAIPEDLHVDRDAIGLQLALAAPVVTALWN